MLFYTAGVLFIGINSYVCMVRAYPQSLNHTSRGSGESRQNQQHHASSERTSRSNRYSGPTIGLLPPPAQNFARNQRRQFPVQEFSEPRTTVVSRRLGNDNRPPEQQPRNSGHQLELEINSRQVLPQQTSNWPHSTQQNAHRAQYRSIQPRNKDAPNNNDDQNRIEKPNTITVNTNHERPAPTSRAYLSPPEGGHKVVNTRRFSEELKMPPQPSLQSHARGQTTAPVQGRNVTSVPQELPQDSSKMPRTPLGLSDSEEGIVFPGQKMTIPRLGEDAPTCANGRTYCEDTVGYPMQYITKLIKKQTSLYKSLFGTDVLVPEIANRISPDEELCKYDEQIAYPTRAKNKDDQWTWIANTEEFKQGVRVEVCQSVNSACGFDGFLPVGYTNSCVQKTSGSECQLISNTPMGYKTECKQKHIYRRLVSVSNSESLSTDEFLFPSCCVCSVKKVEKK